jgi:CRISPR type I-E-associated protein CasB/Cse2
LIASLFALHPQAGGRLTFGRAFRKLRAETGSDSIEKRFVHLLDSAREDLDVRLRHAVALLKANDIAVDWSDLLDRVLAWGYASRKTQRAWATEYWAEGRGDAAEPSETSVPVIVEGAAE